MQPFTSTSVETSRERSNRLARQLAKIAMAVAIATATGHNVAWADNGPGDSSAGPSSQSGTAHPGPEKSEDSGAKSGQPKTTQQTSSDESDGTTSAKPTSTEPTSTKPTSSKPTSTKPAPDTDDTASATGTTAPAAGATSPATTEPTPETPVVIPSESAQEPTEPSVEAEPKTTVLEPVSNSKPAADGQGVSLAQKPSVATAKSAVTPATDAGALKSKAAEPDPTAVTKAAGPATEVAALVATVDVAPNTTTTPIAPQPLSPIAQILALPGQIINTVLQLLDFTVSATGPQSPFNFGPIDQALFAVFRRVEDFLGLSNAPASPPVVPTLTYTGPTTGTTPTVAQFLNAAAAGYVLGGQPGGLQPFTVNGFQMQTVNPLSGAVGQAWVTPEGQIIIAYQGTTGGTNLLLRPLIAISQFITDLQVIFTNTTPQAFHDSLAFEKQVEAAAVAQGYSADDIFLTGHSLGGWEAQYVAQQTGRGGIGFEGPGLNTTVPGNGVNSNFVNVETYGDTAAYFSTDLPGLQPFMPPYVPGGGSKPHYGNIVMVGDPSAVNPLLNASALWGTGPVGAVVFVADILGNFFAHHLPGMQAYNLGVTPDPGVVPWLGTPGGSIRDWGGLTITQLQQAASDAGALIAP